MSWTLPMSLIMAMIADEYYYRKKKHGPSYVYLAPINLLLLMSLLHKNKNMQNWLNDGDELSYFLNIVTLLSLFSIVFCYSPAAEKMPNYNLIFVYTMHGWAILMSVICNPLGLLLTLEIATWAILLWFTTVSYQAERNSSIQVMFILSLLVVLPALILLNLMGEGLQSGNQKTPLTLFFFFLLPAVKIPMMGLHIWLPKAHVESSTLGSLLLAGLFLKLGIYVMLRLYVSNNCGNTYPFLMALAISFMVSAGLHVLLQMDLKRLIALSSVVHLNLLFILFPTKSTFLIQTIMMTSIAHTIISNPLFIISQHMSEKAGSRNIMLLHSLTTENNMYSLFFFLYFFFNATLPLTLMFYVEIFTMSLLPAMNAPSLIVFWVLGSLLVFFYNVMQMNKVNYFKAKFIFKTPNLEVFYLYSLMNFMLSFSLIIFFMVL